LVEKKSFKIFYIEKSLNKFTRDLFGDGDWLNFIREGGKHEILSMFDYKEKIDQIFKGPMFVVEIKVW
jgi:hypothetical protein